MTLPTEILSWMNDMYNYLKNLKQTQTVSEIHPAMPGTQVLPTTTEPTIIPAFQVSETSATTQTATIPQQNVPGVNISPDFENPVGNEQFPTKIEGSVLTITCSRACDYITGEIFDTDQNGNPTNLLIVNQSNPGEEKLLLKLKRADRTLAGKIYFLRVRLAPPKDESYGLETRFIIK